MTSLFVWVFTGRPLVSLAVAGLDFVSKTGLFWLHERLWDRIAAGRADLRPAVIWLTGLSGAGKTTLATWLVVELKRRGYRVEHLDGDSVRKLFPSTGFTADARDTHIQRMGLLAAKLEEHGVVVVASFISPYAASRNFVRSICKTFVEVHVATPLEECERRDAKGLYTKARRGELDRFTGVSDPYEAPCAPEVVVYATGQSIEGAGATVLRRVKTLTSTRA